MKQFLPVGAALLVLALALLGLASAVDASGLKEQEEPADRLWRQSTEVIGFAEEAPDGSSFHITMLAKPGDAPHFFHCLQPTANDLGGMDYDVMISDGWAIDHPEFDGVLRYEGQSYTLNIWPREGDWSTVTGPRDLERQFDPK